MLALPATITACLFDLDGVLTPTAEIHAQAWKETFDSFLRDRARRTGRPLVAFDPRSDYDQHVDGRPRVDGVAAFLESRGITLPARAVHALADRKNDRVVALIRARGVAPYPGSLRFVTRARDEGLRLAVVSSSANCREVLAGAGIDHLFAACVDGVVAEREHLAGKPAPDTFLAGARLLGAEPHEAAVFEDSLAGVAAARAGAFGWVVGVDRTGQATSLHREGAHVVVRDLAELLQRA